METQSSLKEYSQNLDFRTLFDLKRKDITLLLYQLLKTTGRQQNILYKQIASRE